MAGPDLLGPRWPDRDPSALAFAVRILLPVVFVPPRGVWGRSGPVAFTTVDAWLGEPVPGRGSLEDLVLRYLAGMWRIARERREVRLRVEPFGRLSRRDRAAVEEEGTALLGLVAAEAETSEVEFG